MTSPLTVWRERLALTQEQAAKRLRINQAYFSRLERGKRLPGGATMLQMRKARLSIDALVDYAAADRSAGTRQKRVA